MARRSFPAVLMRGGTSKALFFHRWDLPKTSNPHDCESWNNIFLAAMGSPDPYGRQLNGIGGGESSLSKVAIIEPSARADSDIDYTFVQVGIQNSTVGYRGNCGNISSAVGPFAIDEGLVPITGKKTDVRIFNTNTGKRIIATVPIENGKAAATGNYMLPGVSGFGAPIRLSFLEPGAATTGKLFPTGNKVDELQVGDKRIKTSLIDVANPVVCLLAKDLGLSGTENTEVLRDNFPLLDKLESIRIAAAVEMELVQNECDAKNKLKNLPLLAILSNPVTTESEQLPHLQVRMVSAGLPHKAIPLTGAMCLAAAARLGGTLVELALSRPVADITVTIAHPSGTIDIDAIVEAKHLEPIVRETIVYRTARRLMEGKVFI